MKKKVLSIVLTLCIACGVLSLTGCGDSGKVTLNVDSGQFSDEALPFCKGFLI